MTECINLEPPWAPGRECFQEGGVDGARATMSWCVGDLKCLIQGHHGNR